MTGFNQSLFDAWENELFDRYNGEYNGCSIEEYYENISDEQIAAENSYWEKIKKNHQVEKSEKVEKSDNEENKGYRFFTDEQLKILEKNEKRFKKARETDEQLKKELKRG